VYGRCSGRADTTMHGMDGFGCSNDVKRISSTGFTRGYLQIKSVISRRKVDGRRNKEED
jgi:hypothetical protein